ncbi:glutathione S-transferase family protein [Mesorhizobium sp. A623]
MGIHSTLAPTATPQKSRSLALKLHWSPRSPFVRKVMIVLNETGQVDDVDYIRTIVTATTAPNPDLLLDNPLCQIPTLMLDDGSTLYDSAVICEFFDERAVRAGLFPPSGPMRFKQLRWQSIGDGLSRLLQVYRNEALREEGGNAVWISAYRTKIQACLQRIEAEVLDLEDTPFGIGHIALICGLGQLDFRFGHTGWQARFPKAAAWYQAMCGRPSVVATEVDDDSMATVGSSPFAQAKVPLEW